MPQISINGLLGDNGPSYPENIVTPYRMELIQAGFKEMFTPGDVDQYLNSADDKIVLVVLNSVCGCSARVGRPGVILSLFNQLVPDIQVTLFAGMEKEAVTHFRHKYLAGLTPSSPNIAIFKTGQLLHILHRYQIERMTAEEISNDLRATYDKECKTQQSKDTRDKLRNLYLEKYQADPLQLPTE